MSEDDQDIVTLKIAGIEYQLYCPPEEQSTLIEAGEILEANQIHQTQNKKYSN